MSSSLFRFLPHPLVSATFIAAFVFYTLYGQPLFDDSDMPWHVAAGDWILAHYSIPKHDPFSYTAGKAPWYNLSWLWDIALSAVISISGSINGAFFFGVFTVSCSLALLCYSLQRRGIAEDPVMVTLFVTGLVLLGYSLGRPQQASYICMILFHLLLHESRMARPKSTLVLLPLLMVAWVNLHGFFLVGFTLIGAYGLEALTRKDQAWFRYLFFIGLACFVAVFVNPYGVGVIAGALRTLDSVITSYIKEWHPFTYGAVLSSTLYVLVIFLISNPRDKDIPLADKILTFCWLLMAFNSIRNFVVLVLLAAPYMAMNMQKAMVLHTHPDVSAPCYRLRMACFALVAASVLWLPQTQRFLGKDTASGHIPTEEMAFIREHYPNMRFMNDYNLGGYLVYYMHDKEKIFVDGRAGTAYSEKILADSISFFSLSPGFEKLFEKYGIQGILIKKDHPFAKYYEITKPKGWQKAFTGKVGVVYVQNSTGR